MVAQRFRVIVLSEAVSDLRRILDYIASDSPKNSAAVIDYVWKSMQSLADFPHRYPVRRQHANPAKTVRLMPVPPFVVYYRIDDRQHVVRVMSVRHGRRRRPRQFP